MQQRVFNETGRKVHAQTIRRILKNGRTPRRKPMISGKNRKKRLQFVKTFINKISEYWGNVIFSDETKIELFGSHRQGKIWRN